MARLRRTAKRPGSQYQCQGRWLARAYRKGEHSRGPKPGTQYRSHSEQRQGRMAASATSTARE
jgi:hypothetical protein